jgi:hypothetical protein
MPHIAVLRRLSLLTGCALVFLSGPAWSDDGMVSSPRLPAYQAECAACHIAYPPGLLGAKSWQQIMAGLSKHFGVDASLDAGSTKTIGDWLTVHAGTGRRFSTPPPDNRITKSNWFLISNEPQPPTESTAAGAGCTAAPPPASAGAACAGRIAG